MLVDVTQNYGASFYSCAIGMGLGAVCLALVGPAKTGLCHRRKRDDIRSREEEKKLSQQENNQVDFLEVDLASDDSPVKQNVSL